MILEEKARELSRSAHVTHTQVVEENLYQDFLKKHPATLFTGYQETTAEAKIVGILVDGAFVKIDDAGPRRANHIRSHAVLRGKRRTGRRHRNRSTQKQARFVVSDCQNPYRRYHRPHRQTANEIRSMWATPSRPRSMQTARRAYKTITRRPIFSIGPCNKF